MLLAVPFRKVGLHEEKRMGHGLIAEEEDTGRKEGAISSEGRRRRDG